MGFEFIVICSVYWTAICFLCSSALAKCECGYAVKGQGTYTDAFEADFFNQNDIANDGNWNVSRYLNSDMKPHNMQYKLENVIPNPKSKSSGDPGLQLYVRGPTADNAPVSAAELMTTRGDMHYGSYRVALKYSREAGTCGSMFWMEKKAEAPKQEIDVELLSYQDTASSPDNEIHFVNHGGLGGHLKPHVSFHPSDGYHEYRFDWSPGRVAFYTDGKHVGDLTDGVPSNPGNLLLNHWSNGNAGWTQGPPKQDALMTVAYVKAYFNTTATASPCVNPKADGAVCEVPDQSGPVTPSDATTFLNLHPSSGPGDTTTPATNSTNTNPHPPDEPNSHVPKSSPDNTCGGEQGYDCLANTVGECCSSHGYWYVDADATTLAPLTWYSGATAAYCGEGCQKAFGKCGPGPFRRHIKHRANRHG
ncbi:MAG: hypothetical protein Q9223_007416 [Gallowayella weberi]